MSRVQNVSLDYRSPRQWLGKGVPRGWLILVAAVGWKSDIVYILGAHDPPGWQNF